MDFSYSEEQREVKALAEKILGDQTENEHLRSIDEQDGIWVQPADGSAARLIAEGSWVAWSPS